MKRAGDNKHLAKMNRQYRVFKQHTKSIKAIGFGTWILKCPAHENLMIAFVAANMMVLYIKIL